MARRSEPTGKTRHVSAATALCALMIAGDGLACAGAREAGVYGFDREALVVEIKDDIKVNLSRSDRRMWAALDGDAAFAAVPRPWLKRDEWEALPEAERAAFLERAADKLATTPGMQQKLDAVRLRLELRADCTYAISGGNAPGLDRAATGAWRAEDGEIVLLQVRMGGAEGDADYRGRLNGDRVKFRRGPEDRRGMLPLRRTD